MKSFDLVIKNGTIVDGTNSPRWVGDIAIKDGLIAAIGSIPDSYASATVDATGLIVAPGFIDPHTHFDAQLLWDGRAEPSLEHGVTTVVQGNCSLSLAPLRAEHRDFLSATFRQIEEMPRGPFEAGVQWRWESFPEYLDTIKQHLAINVSPLVGHSMLRLWVMGLEARERTATDDEIAEMQDLLRDCLRAGGGGFSTSWTDIDHEYRAVPCRLADLRELKALCRVLGEFDRVLQVVPEFWDADLLRVRIDILADLSLEFGISTSFSPLFHSNSTPDLVDKALDRIALHAARGARVVPQMQTRPIDYTFDLKAPGLIFSSKPFWWGTLAQPHVVKMQTLHDPDVRAKLRDEIEARIMPMAMQFEFEDIVIARTSQPENAHLIGTTLGQLASKRSVDVTTAMLDLALEEALETCFTMVAGGHSDSAAIGRYLANPLVEIGAADGGAHVARFATYGDTGYLFSKFVRESGALSLELAVHKVTQDVATTWRISGRGALKEGYAADIVIFDLATVDRGPEIEVEDLPAPGYRYIRRAKGIDKVFINGQLAYSQQEGYTSQTAGEIASKFEDIK
jgi:N-acyl-D-aspartate/D-glutamate deacylase